MLTLSHLCMLTTALAAGLVVAAPLASGPASAEQAPSSQIRNIPTPEESRAAMMMPDDSNSALGSESAQTQASGTSDKKAVNPAGAGGDPTTATQDQAAIGGPSLRGASASGVGETTGARSGSETTRNRFGPIGATGQTMPAKFSSRNDILDRTPIMAWPQMLSDQERQSIYQAVMADKSQPATDADALAPASELSTD